MNSERVKPLSGVVSIIISPWFMNNIGERGRVDDLSFFEYLSPFCFLLIEFHCTFSISYKRLPHFVLLLLYFD